MVGAHDDRAGRAQTFDDDVVEARGRLRGPARSQDGVGQALDAHVGLHRDRDAEQRPGLLLTPGGEPAIGIRSLPAGAVRVDVLHRADRLVELLDSAQKVLGHLEAGHLTREDQLADPPGRHPGQVVHCHRRSLTSLPDPRAP
jgi:hypothetical protein